MQSSNKRIAKNTIFLYFRMFLTMGIGLYTSRLVLEALGAIDYGVYSLVGGIVMMFAFLNSAMAASSQRYLSFDIGRNDLDRLQKTFNATLNIHLFIAVIILILAETVGLWFVTYKLNIPADRMIAAHWVYQFSIFTFILNVIQVPYNALLIAREHMGIYAYVSVLENILKLIIALVLVQADTDRLIFYAVLTFCLSFLIRMIYKIYCKRKFKESIYKFYYNKTYYKELISYSGWNLIGNASVVARRQSGNIFLNLFFGLIANAAFGLAMLVQGIVIQFVNNFQTAVNPQIVKSYSKGNINNSLNLIYKSAKFSFFGMLVLIWPFLYNISFLMNIWLKEIPPFTIDFIKLALIYALIETISNPLKAGIQATGKVKWNHIILGSLTLLTIPIIWVVFKYLDNPSYFYWILIGNSIISLIFRVFYLKKWIRLKVDIFLKEVISKIIIVVLVTLPLSYLAHKLMTSSNEVSSFVFSVILITLFNIIVISTIGLSSSERKFIVNTIRTRIKGF